MPDPSKRDVFVDLCTQREYLSASGDRRCANADEIVPSIRRVMALARWARIPVISCVDTEFAYQQVNGNGLNGNGRRNGNGHPGPPANGAALDARKVPCTLLPSRLMVESDNCVCMSLDVLNRHQQAIFTKAHRDPFTNPKFDRLLTELPARRFIVFGLPLEHSLRILALGLLRRGRRVMIVRDACGYWDGDEAGMAMRQLEVKGCRLVTAEGLVRATCKRFGSGGRLRFRRRRPRSVA